ncbi:MAG: NifU family protein [Anaerolineae bacterium]|nr:NifU family protein [Anaerolineae bacterium]
MLSLTETAEEILRDHIANRPDLPLAIRLSVVGRGRDDFRYDFRTVLSSDRAADDVVIDGEGFSIYIDPHSAALLKGAVLDTQGNGSGFKIDNPNPVWDDPRGPQVAGVIEQVVNPGLAMHGGHLILVDVRDDVVYVTFGGGCQGCGMAHMTLNEGVRNLIVEAVPSIQDVVDVTRHALGANPYFSPKSEDSSEG